MTENKTITEKILNVQKKLVAPKNLYNTFGKYHYRNAESILEAAKPLNAEEGLLLTITDEPVLIGDWHYIKASANITDGKDEKTVTAYARESAEKKGMDYSQITGTASSYARKYALNGLYLIDDTKDPDTDEYQNQSKNRSQNNQPKQASQTDVGNLNKEIASFSTLMKERGTEVTPDQVKQQLSITDPTQLSQAEVNQAIQKIKQWSK